MLTLVTSSAFFVLTNHFLLNPDITAELHFITC